MGKKTKSKKSKRPTSIRQLYNFTMTGQIVLLSFSIIGIVFMLADVVGNNDNGDDKFFNTMMIAAGFGVFVLLIDHSIRMLITLFKDLDSLRNNDFITISGRVVGFEKNTDPEDGTQTNSKPIIMIIETDETIVLNINVKLTVGNVYRFNYLKNSRIAEIAK